MDVINVGFLTETWDIKKKVTEDQEPDLKQWARAIAIRIADETAMKLDRADDAKLKMALTRALELLSESESSYLLEELIGTGIIESDYFDDLR